MPREAFDKIDEEYFDTILDDDFYFNGSIKFEDSAIIKGRIEGDIESDNNLIIGPKAVINANVKAKGLECFGKINGNVVIENEAYFHAPAVLDGSLKTTLLTFEKGCLLNGKVSMEVSEEPVE